MMARRRVRRVTVVVNGSEPGMETDRTFAGYVRRALYESSVRMEHPLRNYELEDMVAGVVAIAERALPVLAARQAAASTSAVDPQLAEQVRQDEAFQREQLRLMATICTGLWRAQQNLNELESDASDKARRAARHVSSVMDFITQSGYSIHDHTRQAYDPGMNLNVLTFEPRSDLTREVVTETLKPSVYYQEHCIQVGDVIVGTPAQPGQDGVDDATGGTE